MKVVALVSGGKDSCYNMLQCVMAGHEIVALANLAPDKKDELDSYMYQTVGHQGVELYSEALDIPLFRQPTSGIAIQFDKYYTPTPEDEVEDLYQLLLNIKSKIEIEAVSVGAVLSDYQRLRVENVCGRLGLVSLAYLWRRDQAELLQEMIDYKIDAMIIKVAALGLNPEKHLGLKIFEIQPHLTAMNKKYGLHICGEGGEYETFTLDCPLFKKSILVDDYETVIHSNDNVAPVGYINFRKLKLIDKVVPVDAPLVKRLEKFPIKTADDYVADIDHSEDDDVETDNLPSEIEEYIEIDRLIKEVEPIACSPTIGLNENGWCWIGGIVGESSDSFTATLDAMNKLKDTLSTKNMKLSDIVRICIYVSNLDDYGMINSAYSEVIPTLNPPVRVCFGTCLNENSPVVVTAVASTAQNRHVMHVQSLSHWAPANIGPYSQAIKIDEIIYIAGQIGLVPGSMALVSGGIKRQCKLALRHIGRLIKAMDKETQLRDVVQGVCFVTSPSYIRDVKREWEKRTNNSIMDYIVVQQLPRNASVEWQVWAHKGNTRFQYEETGCVIGKFMVSLRRRWNYENTVSAVVCCVAKEQSEKGGGDDGMITVSELEEVAKYTLNRLILHMKCDSDKTSDNSGSNKLVCCLQVYYRVGISPSVKVMQSVAENLKKEYSVVVTFVPVCHLNHPDMFLSLCAVIH